MKLVNGAQDWRWCHEYARQVVAGDITAGKLIKWACQRHLEDLKRDDIYFDEEAAKSIVLWFSFVPLTDGRMAGKPTVLSPCQIFIVCSLIGWKWSSSTYDDEGHPLKVAGSRRFNQAFVLVGRKWGKTTIAAGLLLYIMYKGGFKPRAYTLATKRDQAKLVWETARDMINLSPRLKGLFTPRANDIQMPSRNGELKPLASDSKSLDGLNPIAATLDECHAIVDRNLYGVIVSAFGAQEEYLMLTITTAGTVLDGICTDLYKNGMRVLDPDDDIVQDNYFYAIYQIDQNDDWTDQENWYKANPDLGKRPKLGYMRERFKEAEMSTEEKANFLTKHCNIFVSGSDKWLDMDDVKANRDETLNLDDFKHKTLYVAIDRSRVLDITSFTLLFPSDNGGCDLFFKNFLPRETMESSGDYLKSVYKKAESEGDLELLSTSTVRDEPIKAYIDWLVEEFPNLQMIGYDPWHMREIAEDMEETGVPMVSVSQGTGNMSEPAKKLEGLIKERLIRYDSRMFEFACSCAVASITKKNNMEITRENPKLDKIDPVISTIIALSCATLISVDTNIYDERGMLFI